MYNTFSKTSFITRTVEILDLSKLIWLQYNLSERKTVCIYRMQDRLQLYPPRWPRLTRMGPKRLNMFEIESTRAINCVHLCICRSYNKVSSNNNQHAVDIYQNSKPTKTHWIFDSRFKYRNVLYFVKSPVKYFVLANLDTKCMN